LRNWDDLAEHLVAVVLPPLGIPASVTGRFHPRPGTKPPEMGGEGIARLAVYWQDWKGKGEPASWIPDESAISAEFDLENGNLTRLRFYDNELIELLSKKQAEER
jgi:hypothetical protein